MKNETIKGFEKEKLIRSTRIITLCGKYGYSYKIIDYLSINSITYTYVTNELQEECPR